MEKNQKPHIIIIAPPFQGHLNPLIQLTLKLASKGFTITFVNTHWVHHQITKTGNHENIDSNIFSGSGLDIRYMTISDGLPLSFDRSLHRDQFMEARLHVFPARVDEFVGQLMGSGFDPPPTCLVADTFQTWSSTIARKYGLVHVSFWTQPALILTLYYHLDLLKKNGHYGSSTDNGKDTIDYIPGVKALETIDLISFLQETDTSTLVHTMIQKAFTDIRKADFIICNTVDELEPEPLSIMKAMQPTYAIGPLYPAHFANWDVEMNLLSESDCTKWLNSKPQGSVLYVSFGSYVQSNREDIKIIANGLMLSGVYFIWILRPDIVNSDVADILPQGFQENVENRGLIVPWCNQNVVLSHSSVGGFLTHCGWNSILESIWCGVPLICLPLLGDQTTNRKLAVEDWKIGINLCEGKLASSNEIAEKIKFVMNKERSSELRKAVEEVRMKVENALYSNGSSQINFDAFVKDLKGKTESNKNWEKKM